MVKTIAVNKLGLIGIISWTYIIGFLDGKKKKKGSPSKKDYDRVKRFIMDTCWYKKGYKNA